MERPLLTETDVSLIVERLYGLKVQHQKKLPSYDDINIFISVNSQSQNQFISHALESGYVLKILNSEDSKKVDFIDAMHEAIQVVSSSGIVTSAPVKNIFGTLYSVEAMRTCSDNSTTDFIVRLFEYVPGEILRKKPYTSDICFQIGQLAAEVDLALKNVNHKSLSGHKRHWSLTEVVNLTDILSAVDDPDDRKLVQDVVFHFRKNVMENSGKLLKGVIHADFNEGNIIVQNVGCRKEGPKDSGQNDRVITAAQYEICGLLDFGDLVKEYCIFEVAIAAMYTIIESKLIDPLQAGGHMIAGYLEKFRLPDFDLSILQECIAGRFAQSLVYGAYEHKKDPANIDCLYTSKRGWPLLRQIWSTPKSELYVKWQEILDMYHIDVKLNSIANAKYD